nr:hypothetical protein [Planococcus halocryophilus]
MHHYGHSVDVWIFNLYSFRKKINALEKKVRQLEKQLTQIQQGEEWIEPEINDELRELLQKVKIVEAMKRTREEFGWSLLDAKQYVDRLKEDH